MPLPSEIDLKIKTRFGDLINEGKALVNLYDKGNLPPDFDIRFVSLRTNLLSLLEYLPCKSGHLSKIADTVYAGNVEPKQLLGFIIGLQKDYKAGMLESFAEAVEAHVMTDYMGQAEQLLMEGATGNHDHIPAAVLVGAILEDVLRRLCQRQSPPIDLLMPDGGHKTLHPLIIELQKADVFNKAKAEQLRAWSMIRNYAAHGEFSEFTRSDVEAMIAGVKNFIEDFLQ